jgi:2-polyprenyl-3-methyl-5-hydroxy-6-metoxy-1,4-benzoquinol methylase
MPPGKAYDGNRLESMGMGRSSRSEGYVLRGGRAGAERLRLLNRVKWPTTEPLLRVAGLRAGMSCLDVGCGGGDVTLKMAALVGAEGHVVGIDRDQSILHLARQEADKQGLHSTLQ